MQDFSCFFSEFKKGHGETIHMAGHSHHWWPNASKKGQLKYWEDSAKLSDQKWQQFLGSSLQKTQTLIAKLLDSQKPNNIAFAPNTHELDMRLLSCVLKPGKKIKVLTTNEEFHSFSRQANALEEQGFIELVKLNVEGNDFYQQLAKEMPSADMTFLSHVTFLTGRILDLDQVQAIAKKQKDQPFVCIDGYHSFGAISVDWSKYEDDFCYLAGGYKYAMAGEGMCFLVMPDYYLKVFRPWYTGWFAAMDELESGSKKVSYTDSAFRFWGATQDLSSHFRFQSGWEEFFQQGIELKDILNQVNLLQEHFLQDNPLLEKFIFQKANQTGSFLSLNCGNNHAAKNLYEKLKSKKILTDYRGPYLRFGFGPYLSLAEIEKVKEALA